MAVDKFQFKPSKTEWIGVEIIVEYSCEDKPKVERVRITGVKQFGLILSHEYDIDARVHAARKKPCRSDEDCQHSMMYEFDVKVFVANVFGFGIGIGKLGTGTAGWTTKSREELLTFATSCLCCDDEKTVVQPVTLVKVVPAPANAIPWFVGFGGIGTALGWAGMNFDHPSLVPRIVIYGTAAGVLTSIVVAGLRLLKFLQRKNFPSSTASLKR